MDRIMGQLMNGLKQINLHRCLNIIILADHGNTLAPIRAELIAHQHAWATARHANGSNVVSGMENTSCERKEVLQDFVGNISNYWVTEGAFGRIRAINNDTERE